MSTLIACTAHWQTTPWAWVETPIRPCTAAEGAAARSCARRRTASAGIPLTCSASSGVNARDRVTHPVDAVDVGRRAGEVAREQLAHDREEDRRVRAGTDEVVLVGDLRGLGPARVEHDESPTARGELASAPREVRNGPQGAVRGHRVVADEHEEVGAVDVGHREEELVAVERPGDDLVGQLVDRRRGEAVPRAQQAHEGGVVGQGTEAVDVRVAEVDRDARRPRARAARRPAARRRTGSPSSHDTSRQPRRRPDDGSAQPVGVLVDVLEGERLGADVAARERVGLVPADGRDRPLLVEPHLEAAHRLAQGAREVPDVLRGRGGHRRRGSKTGATRFRAASRAIVVFRVARSRACSTRSRAKVRRSDADQVRPNSRLVAATASGERVRHLLEEAGRGDERLVVHLARQPQRDGPLTAHDLTGHRQPLRDVHGHLLRERLDAAHVRDEPPLGLHDRPLGVGRRHPQVRGEGDLEPAAVAVAVHGRDDRHRDPAPRPAGLLEEVGPTERVGHERARDPGRVRPARSRSRARRRTSRPLRR